VKAVSPNDSLFSLSLTNESELQKQFSLGINIQVPTAKTEAVNELSRGGCSELCFQALGFHLTSSAGSSQRTKRSPRGAAISYPCQGLRPENAFFPPLMLLINFVCLFSFFKAFAASPIRTRLKKEKKEN